MGILEIIITITLFLYPLGELVRIDVAKNAITHPYDIGVLLIVFTWAILQIKAKKNILKIPNLKPFLIFFIVCLCSLLVNAYWIKLNELIVATLYLARWFAYAGVYFAVKDTSALFRSKVLPSLLVIDGLIILILGFAQLRFIPDLIKFTHFQWDRHAHRLFSVFLDPNFAGAFLVLYLLFIAASLAKSIKDKKQKLIFLYGIIGGATLLAVYLTYSRSALLMLLIASVVFLALIRKKIVIAFLIGLTLLYVLISSPNFYIENLNLFRVNSSVDRIHSATIALQIIEKNPILGVGFNAYRYAQEKYNFRSSDQNFSSHADAGTDNSFLFVIATTGLIGLISYVYIWINVLKKAYYKSFKKRDIFASCAIASVTGLSVSALFINSLFYVPLMLWLWIIIALTDSR